MTGLKLLRRRRMGIPFQNTLLRPIHGALGLRHPWLRTVLKGDTHPTLRVCSCRLLRTPIGRFDPVLNIGTCSSLHRAMGGRWEWVSKTVRSHGWRSSSVTWTCRRSEFWTPTPNGHIHPSSRQSKYQATSNNPAAPMPVPTHMVTTTYLTPRRLPSISAWPTRREPVVPYG